MLYKYKPIDPTTRIEALQWTGKNIAEVSEFVGKDNDHGVMDLGRIFVLWCKKSNGDVQVPIGDYIVLEPDGDGFYPCAEIIFEAKYEAAEAPGH